MNKNPETALVPIHGHQLLTIKDGETIRVAMKPICDAIGLDWSAQFRRIERHAVLGTCVAIMAMQLPGEMQSRDIVTLPLDYLNGWLFGIDSNRVKLEIKDLLIEYQRECFAALAAYWQQGVATNPRARAATIPQLLATQRQVNNLMQALKRETSPAIRRNLHAQLEQSCRLLSLPTPGIGDIGTDAVADHESPVLAEFWEIYDLLAQNHFNKINHSRNTCLIALNLPEVRAAASAAKLDLPDMCEVRRVLKASLDPEFVDFKAVNSRHHGVGTIKCWVFKTLG